MALIYGLRRWVSLAAAVSLVVTMAALILALAASASARGDGRVLSQRLVPAAGASAGLLAEYVAQQTALRDYVTRKGTADLQSFVEAASKIPGRAAKTAVLVRGYPRMPGQLAVAEVAHRRWLAAVAGPQLAAAAKGDFARARALQANIGFTRPYTTAVRTAIAVLQQQVTSMQARVTARLLHAQAVLLGAQLAVCLVVALIALGAVVAVRYWLLAPFSVLRGVTESIAAGNYETRVPAIGPAELADLGRSTELMRARLVTALARTERAEERFRGLFHEAPDATLTVAEDGTIVMVNAQVERMFGYSAAELVGQAVEILVPAAAHGVHPGERAGYFAEPGPRSMGPGLELSAVRKDGQEFPVEISLNSLQMESGMVASATIRDISDRLAAQADRERFQAEKARQSIERRHQQSERMESLGQLVGGVAHDFNNLLNVIAGYTDFVAEEVTSLGLEDDRAHTVLADVEQVRGAAQRAMRLTRQLLMFAGRNVVHPEVLDLGSVIGGVEQLLCRAIGAHIELVITLGDGLWPVMADAGQLEQVLVNLAINARDAMPAGGKLIIDTSNIDVDQAYTTDRPDLAEGRYIRLRVSDTGQGMSPEVLARVFEPFYSTKPKDQGTGLGLATVYGIITQAGGHAQIYSEPGLGTTVTAMMPAADVVAGAPEPDAAEADPAGSVAVAVESVAGAVESVADAVDSVAVAVGSVAEAVGSVAVAVESAAGPAVADPPVPVPVPVPVAVPVAMPAEPARGHGETILLVEDEPSLWQLANRILTRHGYVVCAAVTPAEALLQVADLQQPIDLMFTDVIMPGMMGNELAERMRAIRPSLPVLYMSGYAELVLHTQGVLDADVDLLEKPFSEVNMLARVARALAGTARNAASLTGSGPAADRGQHRGGIGEIRQHHAGLGRGQLGGAGRAGGHGDRPCAGRLGRGHVERSVANDHGRLACEVPAVGPGGVAAGQVDQLGPVLVMVAVGADVEVQVAGQPQRFQLGLGERADVPGEDRLHDQRRRASKGGDGGQRRGCSRQGPADVPDHRAQSRSLRGQPGQECLDVPLRVADPGPRQRVQGDGPVGPPGHGRDGGQLAAEQFAEDHVIGLVAAAARVDQGVIDVPQHQQVAHGATVSAGRGCRRPARSALRAGAARPGRCRTTSGYLPGHGPRSHGSRSRYRAGEQGSRRRPRWPGRTGRPARRSPRRRRMSRAATASRRAHRPSAPSRA
jgi:PAS domain S-box-containing protein